MARIDEGTKRGMALSMGGQSAAANAQRMASERAMDKVAAYSGGNPLAMSAAMAGLGTDEALGGIYQQGGAQRGGLLMQQLGLQSGAEGLLAQIRGQATAGQQAVLGAIDDSEPGILGSLISAAGMAIGCWVAREVYGESNPTWLLFRRWMFADAPKWLLRLYLRYGERFAVFISDKPRLKRVIRVWMNSRIRASVA